MVVLVEFLHSGGFHQYVFNIDYITISTQGNATDFGDSTISGSNMVQHFHQELVDY